VDQFPLADGYWRAAYDVSAIFWSFRSGVLLCPLQLGLLVAAKDCVYLGARCDCAPADGAGFLVETIQGPTGLVPVKDISLSGAHEVIMDMCRRTITPVLEGVMHSHSIILQPLSKVDRML